MSKPKKRVAETISITQLFGGIPATNSIKSVWVLLERSVHSTCRDIFQKHFCQNLDRTSMRLNLGNRRADAINRTEMFIRGIAGRWIACREPVG